MPGKQYDSVSIIKCNVFDITITSYKGLPNRSTETRGSLSLFAFLSCQCLSYGVHL